MSDEQIAKIDGKCQCERPLAKRKPLCGNCHHKHRPDYRAPENLHELVRVLKAICKENDWAAEITLTAFTDAVIITDRQNGKVISSHIELDSLSDALIVAIIEAKG